MKHFPPFFSHLQGRDLTLMLLVGGTTAAILFTALRLEAKWVLFIVLSISCLAGAAVITEREKFFLYLAVFLLPLHLDFHLIYLKTPFVMRPIYGINITALDLPLFFLLLSWMLRIATGQGEAIRFYPLVSLSFLLMWALCVAGLSRSDIPGVLFFSALWLMFKNWLIFL